MIAAVAVRPVSYTHLAEAKKRYETIAAYLGLETSVDALCNRIVELNNYMGIPNTLKEFGIKEDEFKEKISEIAKNAVGDACTGSNPVSYTHLDVYKRQPGAFNQSLMELGATVCVPNGMAKC